MMNQLNKMVFRPLLSIRLTTRLTAARRMIHTDKRGRQSIRQQVDRIGAWHTKASLAALGVGLIGAYAYSQQQQQIGGGEGGKRRLHAEAPPRRPTFTKEQVSLLCFVGYPQAGKSEQARKTAKKWSDEGWRVVNDVHSIDDVRKAIETTKGSSKGQRSSLIIDGFPTSLDEAKQMENELCEIFCYVFFNMERDEWTKRTGQSDKAYDDVERALKPLREAPREKGNVLEIAAGWPKEEVWDMVEAKVEQILELRQMGEM